MIYVDTSAFLKRVRTESGSSDLVEYLADRTDLASSTLLAVEARRGIVRTAPAALPLVDVLLSGVALIDVSDAVIESASRLPGAHLRSLDAIHLATALLLDDELDELVTYDDRLAEAAREHGITVVAPGA